MLLLTLVYALLDVLTQVADSLAAVPDAAWYSIGLLGIWQIVGPIAASWLYKQWGALQAKLTGIAKAIGYVVFSTLTLQLPKLVGYALDPDPNNWTAAAFFDLLTSVGATILYRFGGKPNAKPSP